MPTPVTTARECLTPDASQALNEAVSVARRRGHAQTTSLHAVTALLSIPTSALREACLRARNGSYSSRIQFKALELCLTLSLDRIPTAPQYVDEPPISNSLMAAIKRSQANQRRQPENFHFHQQPQQSSITTVKVELRYLILSILDDPVVSRVFGEAGFRNCDIKLALLRPVHQLLRYSRYKGPPIFLCNLIDDSDLYRRGFNLPYMSLSSYFNSDENCKRIGELLVRKKRRNPLLVGVCALDALNNFSEIVQNKKGACVLPLELSDLNLISIENEVVKFVTGDDGEGLLKSKLEEISGILEDCIAVGGVVISFGDLQGLVGDDSSVEAMNYVIQQLANFVSEKSWLIGAAASYETFMKFLNKFPSIEKDWDLQLLPITSPKTTPMAETYPRSSLMESFVPFGGFFSAASHTKKPIGASNQYMSRCYMCDAKCEQEVRAISKGGIGYSASVADHYQSSLPSLLQMAEINGTQELGVIKAKDDDDDDDDIVLSAKVVRLQKKWDSICQHLHLSQHSQTKPNSYLLGSQVPAVIGFQVVTNKSPTETRSKNINSSASTELLQNSPRTNSASPNSVTTDLGLGMGIHADFPGQLDHKDFKMIYTSLVNLIGRQEAAITVISQTIVRKRNEKHHGTSRTDIWFNFQGPDQLCKKKIGISLAEILFRSKECFVCINLSFDDSMVQRKDYEMKFRGKTVVDHITDELIKKPLSVVYLENIEKADLQAQKSLLQAVRTGRFSDSHGREVGIGNTIFVMASRFTDISKLVPSLNETENYLEENVLRATGRKIQMLIGFDLGDNVTSQNLTVLDITRKGSESSLNKRKLICNDGTVEQSQTADIVKRIHKTTNADMDLNLPAEESEYFVRDSNTWLEDLFVDMDETVIFEPFDYGARSEELQADISGCFRKAVGTEVVLEIDSKVMDQIVAATCLLDENRVRQWVEQILSKAFVEAKKRYNLSTGSVVQLVNCVDDEEAQGFFLPDRIVMN